MISRRYSAPFDLKSSVENQFSTLVFPPHATGSSYGRNRWVNINSDQVKYLVEKKRILSGDTDTHELTATRGPSRIWILHCNCGSTQHRCWQPNPSFFENVASTIARRHRTCRRTRSERRISCGDACPFTHGVLGYLASVECQAKVSGNPSNDYKKNKNKGKFNRRLTFFIATRRLNQGDVSAHFLGLLHAILSSLPPVVSLIRNSLPLG